MKRNRSLLALVLMWLLVTGHVHASDYFVFTSFRGNGEDGLHLAVSTNGYYWQALKGDRSFLAPAVGGKLIRDPCLAQGHDGVFHMVWTSGWTTEGGKVIGYASTKDLVNWSGQRAIELMQNQPATRNIWAPEIFYDRGRRRWLLFWSSTVPGQFSETAASGDDGYNHRFFCATTRDFNVISESRLLYDPGFNCIDATLLQDRKQFILFFKDERKQPLKKNLRYAVAPSPEGPFSKLGEPFTVGWVEGPSAIKVKGQFLVYFDHYSNPQYYGAYRSKNLRDWTDCSKEVIFPKGHRHGTVLRIPENIARTLLELGARH